MQAVVLVAHRVPASVWPISSGSMIARVYTWLAEMRCARGWYGNKVGHAPRIHRPGGEHGVACGYEDIGATPRE